MGIRDRPRIGAGAGSSRGIAAHLEVRDYEGELLQEQHLTRADSVLFSDIKAARGNPYYLATDKLLGWPVVLEYSLEVNQRQHRIATR